MDIKGKTALVTGGAKRVGKTIALFLARRGAHIAITYQTSKSEALDTVAELKDTGVKAIAVQGDVSKLSHVKKLVGKTLSNFGSIEILINNAAIFYRTPFEEIQESDWDRHMDIN